ncbi:hypothetical protein PR048_013169 [Dryococelus australis]|uniref:Integrase catalytic domain-containing protein n=1 Tax=Dryococelus australis TaxID=614101 RepID=A0ABQ9HRQ4_9NEOP|nr:hypothetical protein PR048_013169 [Dryococelus australis]
MSEQFYSGARYMLIFVDDFARKIFVQFFEKQKMETDIRLQSHMPNSLMGWQSIQTDPSARKLEA